MAGSFRLVREVLAARGRAVGEATLALLVASSLALGAMSYAWSTGPHEVQVFAVEIPVAPTIDEAPPPAPQPEAVPAPELADDPPVPLRRCPVARTDAPRLRPPALPEPIDRVMVSPSNTGWVAAWNLDHVYVSTDAGASFERVLDGPGAIADVGFDCLGSVIAIRGERVGVRVGAREAWRRVPALAMTDDDAPHAAVVSGGPEIVVVGRRPDWDWAPRIARSADGGRRWRYHDVVEGEWSTPIVTGRQLESGRIEIAMPAPDCRSVDTLHLELDEHGVTTWLGGYWRFTGEEVSEDGLPEGARWLGDDLVASPTGALFVVRDDRVRPLSVIVEGESAFRDRAGRVWTIVCGRPWIARSQPSGYVCTDDDAP